MKKERRAAQQGLITNILSPDNNRSPEPVEGRFPYTRPSTSSGLRLLDAGIRMQLWINAKSLVKFYYRNPASIISRIGIGIIGKIAELGDLGLEFQPHFAR